MTVDRRPFGIHFGTKFVAPDTAAQATELECDVFTSSFGTTPDEHAAEYARYDEACLFITVVDRLRRVVAGSARVVLSTGLGLKTVHDLDLHWQVGPEVIGEALRDPDQTWDIASLSVGAGYRNGVVSQILHQALGTSALRSGVGHFVAVLDLAVFRLLRWQLRGMFQAIAGIEPKWCNGNMAIGTSCDFVSYLARIEREAPHLHETVFLGRHLDEIVVPPDWDQLPEIIASVRGGIVETSVCSELARDWQRSLSTTAGITSAGSGRA